MNNVPIVITMNVFAEESNTTLSVTLDKHNMYTADIVANKSKQININTNFSYKDPGWKRLTIIWRGDTECANKLFTIKDITIDDQVIDVYGIKQFPDLTQYIANLGKEELNKKLTKPSSRFGWYGEYRIDVFIGDQQDYVKAYNHPSKILGIIGNKVITNPDHVKITRTKK